MIEDKTPEAVAFVNWLMLYEYFDCSVGGNIILAGYTFGSKEYYNRVNELYQLFLNKSPK
jgi:hypothetical protein